MMKNSSILRWTNNKNASNKQNGNKNWLHPADSLQKGHIAYLVKFLGSTVVEQPKGFDVVKEAIRKLNFSQQLRKAEGVRTPKVELTISVDGVAIHEPKTKRNLHQYPLHRISYCADDKAEKRFFSFIAKEADAEQHTCYVFVSDKLAEEITLTIGQAFDLAYRRFLETSGRELELRRQVASLQNKLKIAENENALLRQKLEGAGLNDTTLSLENGLLSLENESSTDPVDPVSSDPPSNLPPLPPRSLSQQPVDDLLNGSTNDEESDDSDFNPRAENEDTFSPRPVTTTTTNGILPPPSSTNGVRNNAINGAQSPTTVAGDDDDFDPRAEEKREFDTPSPATTINSSSVTSSSPPPLIPPPRPSRPHEKTQAVDDIFGSVGNDPFFESPVTTPKTNNNNDDILAQFSEMKAGFSRGLTFGSGDQDFTLDSLDPLKN